MTAWGTEMNINPYKNDTGSYLINAWIGIDPSLDKPTGPAEIDTPIGPTWNTSIYS